MGYGGGSGSGGSGGSGGGSGASGGSGYRRVGDDRTANLKVNNITSRDGKRGTDVDGIVEVNTTAHFIPPSGTTAERGSRGRGVFGGASPETNTIDYITIATTGNATDFGDLTQARRRPSAASSATRGVWYTGRFSGSYQTTVDYITISATGNAFDFGDVTVAGMGGAGTGNDIRGLFVGGYNNSINPTIRNQDNISYITFSSLGNASDFGSLTQARRELGACSSSVRGVFMGGKFTTTAPSYSNAGNTIDYVTIASTGNAQDFGDLINTITTGSSLSSTTRGVYGGGTPGMSNQIQYITIASTGDATDFGDLTEARQLLATASNSIRGVFADGATPTNVNTIDYITIASTGNAADFGDGTETRNGVAGCSDSHGGLG